MSFEEGKYYYVKVKMVQVEDDDTIMFPYRVQFTNQPVSVWVPRDTEIVEEIPEREKVTIPKFVADWIERCKKSGVSVFYAAVPEDGLPKEVNDWLFRRGRHDKYHQDLFAEAFVNGYKIKKAPLYTVEIPDPNRKGTNRIYLGKADNTGKVFINKGNFNPQKNRNLRLTEQEIKKDFEWAWQFAKPVEEDDE